MAQYISRYTPSKKPNRPFVKFFRRFLVVLIIILSGIGYYLYTVIYEPNVWTPEGKPVGVNVPTGSDFKDLKGILYSKGIIIHRKNFVWWAEQKKLPSLVKPGHYLIRPKMNNKELVEMFRSGRQTPVDLTFNNVRDIYQLAGIIGRQIEPDSLALVKLLSDSSYIAKLGFNKSTIPSMFIPNTYEFFWTITPAAFVDRMHKEYEKFWNKQRRDQADTLGLTPEKVSILASIIDKETNKVDEMPVIASVYLNRLDKGWRLQADPTVVFALGDYSIRRVLNAQKRVNSPYNTYRHRGLPPGPICIPSIASIEAVLNPAKTKFLYFCAKDDFSGYHVFANTNRQQELNAEKYQQALDSLKIFR
ncbi:MAG: endolytic transglycosylase MltG [Bacteroidales bacterium]|nr:endolytic transglycosylase MltG [Bacteroidales bacterium]